MRSITTSLPSSGRLIQRLVLFAVLALAATALMAPSAFAAPCLDCDGGDGGTTGGGATTGGTKYQYVISERDGRRETGQYVNQGQTVRIAFARASGMRKGP